jgi:hypothetical protein
MPPGPDPGIPDGTAMPDRASSELPPNEDRGNVPLGEARPHRDEKARQVAQDA